MTIALVTGAASGIGAAICQRLVARGHTVYGADLTPTNIEGTIAIDLDVSDADAVTATVSQINTEHGAIDMLFNNAGIGSTSNPVTCTPEEWDRVFAVNAKGPFLCTRAALPAMIEKRSGVIINTASAAGLIGLADRVAYCASKGAVIAFTKAVAIQYATRGIRCNAVCPGTVDSPWVKRLLDEATDPLTAREALIARQPMGRLGTSDEIAAAALYLASRDAGYITGECLVIDGGIVAG